MRRKRSSRASAGNRTNRWIDWRTEVTQLLIMQAGSRPIFATRTYSGVTALASRWNLNFAIARGALASSNQADHLIFQGKARRLARGVGWAEGSEATGFLVALPFNTPSSTASLRDAPVSTIIFRAPSTVHFPSRLLRDISIVAETGRRT